MSKLFAYLQKSLAGFADVSGTLSAPSIERQPELFVVKPGNELLDQFDRGKLLERIYDQCGIGRGLFNEYYRDTAASFATFVQSLPASEYYHHATPGGLLDHALEAASAALQLRQAYLLPPNTEPDDVRKRSDVWTFGVFVAALFHDVAKVATDHVVELLDRDGKEIGPWAPLSGPMNSPYYRSKFRRSRKYSEHQKLGAVVMRPLISDRAVQWLNSDNELVMQVVGCLSGEKNGVISEIIKNADAKSTAASVAQTVSTPNRPVKSMVEHVTDAFRVMIENGRLPTNKPGAGAWVTNTDVWLVVKRAIDSARDHVRTEHAFSIPGNNQIVMTELQSAKICLPSEDKAVWRAEVKDAEWRKVLTFLRIPIEKLWPDANDRPPAFNGEISVPEQEALKDAKPSSSSTEGPEGIDGAMPGGSREAAVRVSKDAAAMVEPDRPEGSDPSPEATETEAADEPDAFIRWVRDGVMSGRLPVNVRKAPLHVVPEGLLLVSPRIFKQYSGGAEGWKRVQRKLIQRGLTSKAVGGKNVFDYAVTGENRTSTITGMLIECPEAVFEVAFPPANEKLTCVSRLMGGA